MNHIFFASGSKWWIHHSWVRKRRRKPAWSALKIVRFSWCWSDEPVALLIRWQESWHRSNKSLCHTTFTMQNILNSISQDMLVAFSVWFIVKRLSLITMRWAQSPFSSAVAVSLCPGLASPSRLYFSLVNSASHVCTVDKTGASCRKYIRINLVGVCVCGGVKPFSVGIW